MIQKMEESGERQEALSVPPSIEKQRKEDFIHTVTHPLPSSPRRPVAWDGSVDASEDSSLGVQCIPS